MSAASAARRGKRQLAKTKLVMAGEGSSEHTSDLHPDFLQAEEESLQLASWQLEHSDQRAPIAVEIIPPPPPGLTSVKMKGTGNRDAPFVALSTDRPEELSEERV